MVDCGVTELRSVAYDGLEVGFGGIGDVGEVHEEFSREVVPADDAVFDEGSCKDHPWRACEKFTTR